eukprot:s7875_g3.t1
MELIRQLEECKLKDLESQVQNLECKLREVQQPLDPTQALKKMIESGSRADVLRALMAQPYLKDIPDSVKVLLAQELPALDDKGGKEVLRGLPLKRHTRRALLSSHRWVVHLCSGPSAPYDPVVQWANRNNCEVIHVDVCKPGGKGWDLLSSQGVWVALLWGAAAGRVAAVLSSPPRSTWKLGDTFPGSERGEASSGAIWGADERDEKARRETALFTQGMILWSVASVAKGHGVPFIKELWLPGNGDQAANSLDPFESRAWKQFESWSNVRKVSCSRADSKGVNNGRKCIATNLLWEPEEDFEPVFSGAHDAYRKIHAMLSVIRPQGQSSNMICLSVEQDELIEYEPSMPDPEQLDDFPELWELGDEWDDDEEGLQEQLLSSSVYAVAGSDEPPLEISSQADAQGPRGQERDSTSFEQWCEVVPEDKVELERLVEELSQPTEQVVLRYFVELKSKSGVDVAEAVQKMILSINRYFPVRTVHCDLGTEFLSTKLSQWLAGQAVKLQHSLPADKQANGLAERTVAWVKSRFVAVKDEDFIEQQAYEALRSQDMSDATFRRLVAWCVLSRTPVTFDPRSRHAVRRSPDILLVAYSPLGSPKLTPSNKACLEGLGFQLSKEVMSNPMIRAFSVTDKSGSSNEEENLDQRINMDLSSDIQEDSVAQVVGWDPVGTDSTNVPQLNLEERDLQEFLAERQVGEAAASILEFMGVESPADLVFLYFEDLVEFGLTPEDAERTMRGIHPLGTRRPDNPTLCSLTTGEVRLFDRSHRQIPWVFQNRTLDHHSPGPPVQGLGVNVPEGLGHDSVDRRDWLEIEEARHQAQEEVDTTEIRMPVLSAESSQSQVPAEVASGSTDGIRFHGVEQDQWIQQQVEMTRLQSLWECESENECEGDFQAALMRSLAQEPSHHSSTSQPLDNVSDTAEIPVLSAESSQSQATCDLQGNKHVCAQGETPSRKVEEGSTNRGVIAGYVIVYVDDVLILSSRAQASALYTHITKQWECTSLQEATEHEPVTFLGVDIQLARDNKGTVGFELSQCGYIDELLRAYSITPTKKQCPVPKDWVKDLPEQEQYEPDTLRRAQKITGELLWITQRTRVDLAYAVSLI